MKSLVLLFVLAVCYGDRVLFKGTSTTAPNWKKGARALAEQTFTVHAMLRHQKDDVQRLEEVLMKVSDPKSPEYGQHLSLEAVNKMLPISDARLAVVREFFAGANKVDLIHDMMKVELTVAEAERIFLTTVHQYHHANGASLLRADDFSMTSALADAVYVIGDLVELPALRAPVPKPTSKAGGGSWPNACAGLSGCQGLVTPAVLAERYQIDDSGMSSYKNSMAVAEFQGQYFKDSDLEKFSSGCSVNVTVDNVIGGDKERVGVESELDIQYIRGVSPGISLTVIYSQQYSLFDWMSQINGRSDAEFIQSVSYGNDEIQQTGPDYMMSCNVQFMKAGTRGISVLFASGDQGVWGRSGVSERFHPDFPAASPYITAVGGTDFHQDSIGEEQVWSAGGGGFSDTFPIPDWQADVVAAYKANADAELPDQSFWNNTGRGYPDLAALGGQKSPYCVVAHGSATGVAGTSASCPVVAGIFARLNGLRLAAGKAALGWLNPFIYQNGDAFNDVTVGINNEGGDRAGFKAVKGWDPASGFGTPNFKKLATRV